MPAAGVEFTIEADEYIWTESSYKFTAGEILGRLEPTGFSLLRQWVDERAGVALTLARAD
ncbi:Histidine N-alpha-methyltransferase [compost metagenome]